MHPRKKFWERCDRLLVILMFSAVATFFCGTGLNALVQHVNGGSMPINAEPDVHVDNGSIPRHFAKEGSAKLLFLADVIPLELPEIKLPAGKLGDGLREVARLVDYPLEGERHHVSIGDLLRWLSVVFFLITIIPLLVRIPFRLQRDGIRYVSKKKTRE